MKVSPSDPALLRRVLAQRQHCGWPQPAPLMTDLSGKTCTSLFVPKKRKVNATLQSGCAALDADVVMMRSAHASLG